VHDGQSATSQDWKKLLVVSILSTGYCLDGPLQKSHQICQGMLITLVALQNWE
jgi:hypothetical protein